MSKISDSQLKQLLEAAIFVNQSPLSIDKMRNTILSDLAISSRQLSKAIKELELDYAPRGIKLIKVASGYRFQSDTGLGQLLGRLWQENVPKYSRAMLETLALIAYKQPITRGEIEEVRGVAVSGNIIRSLTERQWIKVVGHKEVPGKPSLFATTAIFLDYFALKSLSELPSAEAFTANIEAAMQASNHAPSQATLDVEELSIQDKIVAKQEAPNEETCKDAIANTEPLPKETYIKANIH
ncbi:MAG: segregation and condensation protein B [Alphaproteobacteria bacterium]|jgi:segregation and condensation protein B